MLGMLIQSKYIQKELDRMAKILLMILIMTELGFLCEKKILSKLKRKSNISINVFCYENRLGLPINVSNQKFENSMDLLLVTNENKSHYVYIKGLKWL